MKINFDYLHHLFESLFHNLCDSFSPNVYTCIVVIDFYCGYPWCICVQFNKIEFFVFFLILQKKHFELNHIIFTLFTIMSKVTPIISRIKNDKNYNVNNIGDTNFIENSVQMTMCVICFEYKELNNIVKHSNCAGIVCTNCLLQMDLNQLSRCVYCRRKTNEFSNYVKKIKFENIKIQRAEEAWDVNEMRDTISDDQINDRMNRNCIGSYNDNCNFVIKNITILNLVIFMFSNITVYIIGVILCLLFRISHDGIFYNPILVWIIGILACVFIYFILLFGTYCSSLNNNNSRRSVIIGFR